MGWMLSWMWYEIGSGKGTGDVWHVILVEMRLVAGAGDE